MSTKVIDAPPSAWVPRQAPPALRRKPLFGGAREYGWFLIPGGVFLGIFSLFPLAQLVRMSVSTVTSANLLADWEFVGLKNFISTMSTPEFWQVLGNTLAMVGIVYILALGGGTICALMLADPRRSSRWTLSVMIICWAMPGVVIANLFRFALDSRGPVNQIIALILPDIAPIPWLAQTSTALLAVAVVNAWSAIPFTTIVIRAALLAVPSELIEASSLDGAGPVARFWHIILPMLKPTLSVLSILVVIFAFRSFDSLYVLTNGGPGFASSTLPFLGWKQAFGMFQYSVGAATTVLTILIVIGLAIVYIRAQRKEEQG